MNYSFVADFVAIVWARHATSALRGGSLASLQSRRIWGYDKGHKGYECSMPPSWMIKLKEGWGEAKKDCEGEDDGLKKEEGEGESHAPHPPLLH